MESRSASFSLSLLFFWIKGHVVVTRRDVQCKTANIVLGLIPAGSRQQTIPLANISAAVIDTRFKIGGLIVGIVLALGGLATIGESFFGGVFIFLIAVLIFGGGIRTSLTIQRAGSDYTIDVPFYEKGKLIDVKDAIDEALNYVADKNDMNIHVDRIGEAVGRAVSNANQANQQ